MLLDLWPGVTPGKHIPSTSGVALGTIGRPEPTRSTVRRLLHLTASVITRSDQATPVAVADRVRFRSKASVAAPAGRIATRTACTARTTTATRLESRCRVDDPDEELLLMTAAALMLARR